MPLMFENCWSKLNYLGRGVECSKPGLHDALGMQIKFKESVNLDGRKK